MAADSQEHARLRRSLPKASSQALALGVLTLLIGLVLLYGVATWTLSDPKPSYCHALYCDNYTGPPNQVSVPILSGLPALLLISTGFYPLVAWFDPRPAFRIVGIGAAIIVCIATLLTVCLQPSGAALTVQGTDYRSIALSPATVLSTAMIGLGASLAIGVLAIPRTHLRWVNPRRESKWMHRHR
jgi:Na+/melibiose symporter-like transporter